MKVVGNTILVAGGTSGIGRALAERLHDEGNHVVVAGRRGRLLEEIIEGRNRMIGMQVDLNDAASLVGLHDRVLEQCPELNVVVANAGIACVEDLVGNWNIDSSAKIIETNILGTLRLVSTFLPHLVKQKDASLLVTTSSLAFIPKAIFPTYCATKAFLHSWTQSLRHQLRDTSVDVLELVPPYVRTELNGPAQAIDPRGMDVVDFVSEVLALIEAREHDAGEVLVERVRLERQAERDGIYDAVYAAMNQ